MCLASYSATLASWMAEISAQSGQGIPQSQMGLPQWHGVSSSARRKLWQATHSVPVIGWFLTMNGSGKINALSRLSNINKATTSPSLSAGNPQLALEQHTTKV